VLVLYGHGILRRRPPLAAPSGAPA
jgi:hypothetical protein